MAAVDLGRVPEYYHRYIAQVTETDLDKAFQKHQTELLDLLKGLPVEKWDHRYQKDKWSVKELVQHIIDGERIFGYRALCFARKDRTELPGFDEQLYADNCMADLRTPDSLMEELATVQKSSAQLFASFNQEQLEQSGIANGRPVYVTGIGFIIIGHALHHRNILTDRYL